MFWKRNEATGVFNVAAQYESSKNALNAAAADGDSYVKVCTHPTPHTHFTSATFASTPHSLHLHHTFASATFASATFASATFLRLHHLRMHLRLHHLCLRHLRLHTAISPLRSRRTTLDAPPSPPSPGQRAQPDRDRLRGARQHGLPLGGAP